jgi:hypothetical protein
MQDTSLPTGSGDIDTSNEYSKSTEQLKADIEKLTNEISSVNDTIKLMDD